MSTFDQTIERLAIYFEQVEGMLVLIGVCDDTVLREHTVQILRQRLPSDIMLREFHYDTEHLSLLEGSVEMTALGNGRLAISVTGLETLPRDKRTEAIKLLNLQRNRLGQTNLAVLLWVNRATLAEISTEAADFYSWRSATLFIEPPPGWDVLASLRRSYLEALVAHNAFVNLQGLAPMRGGQIVQMRMEDIFILLQAEQEVSSVAMPRRLHYDGEDSTDELRAFIEDIPDIGKRKGAAVSRWLWHRLQGEGKLRCVDIPELLHEHRVVVLGDPGAGKTTLLRYVAYTLAQVQLAAGPSDFVQHLPDLAHCLPVYIRIGEYAEYLQNHPASTLETFAPAGCQVHQLPLAEELLKDALAQGRVFFLLDGLDEILDCCVLGDGRPPHQPC